MNFKLRVIPLLFCLTGSFLIGFSESARSDEPMHENRTLTSWLQDFNYGRPFLIQLDPKKDKDKTAVQAVQAIGKEALPTLLNRLAIDSGALNTEQRYRTTRAFLALGADARPAIPQLIGLLPSAYTAAMNSPSDKDAALKGSQANGAADILSGIGEAAVQPLIEALNSKDMSMRFGAAMALAGFAKQADLVVPPLIKALADENNHVRWVAARSIGRLQKLPEISIPALTKVARDDPADNVRWYAISALSKFGAAAKPALPDLLEVTRKDPKQYIRTYAGEILQKIKAAIAAEVAVG